jgi:hypothetical protein
MLEIRLEYLGNGRFQTLYPTDFDEAAEKLTPGDKLRAQLTHQRSVRQNNYFHALVQQAHENQRGGKRLPTWRHLRSHLLICAGHCTEDRVSIKGVPVHLIQPMLVSQAKVLRRHTDVLETSFDPKTQEIVYRAAKSWSFRETGSAEAKKVLDRVIAQIVTEIVPGMDVTRFTREARLRAGGKEEKTEEAA